VDGTSWRVSQISAPYFAEDLQARDISVPLRAETVQAEAIKARYTDGALEIAIPKQPRAQSKAHYVTVN